MPTENLTGAWAWNAKRLAAAQSQQQARTEKIQAQNVKAAADFAAVNAAFDPEIRGRGDPGVDLFAAGVTVRAAPDRIDELPGRVGPGAAPRTYEIAPGLYSGEFTAAGRAARDRGAPTLEQSVRQVNPNQRTIATGVRPSRPTLPPPRRVGTRFIYWADTARDTYRYALI